MPGPDLHDRFDAWLRSGAAGDPPRDAAIHASVCGECLRKAAALDSLAYVDLGAAPAPPSLQGATAPARVGRPAFAMGAVVVVIAVTAGALAAPALLRAPRTAEQQILAATGTPVPSAGSSLNLVVGGTTPPTATATPAPSASSSVAEASAGPTAFRTPAPGTVAPTRTADPSPPLTPATTATPAATATPTPISTATPSATPTATPAPTPVPDDCADGIDNDGDGATDLLDPGCTLGTYEAFADPP